MFSLLSNWFKNNAQHTPKGSVRNVQHETQKETEELPQIVAFLEGKCACTRNILLKDIWMWNDYALESRHTYIQWMFPSDMISKAIPDSPVLTRDNIEFLRNSKIAKENMIISLNRMLHFFGLEMSDDGIITKDTQIFHERKKVWLTDNNHNYLRASRILRSLTLLGFKKEASSLLHFLEKLKCEGEPIDFENISYFRAALVEQQL